MKRQEVYRNNKIKSLIDFDEEYVSSVKSLAIKKEAKVTLTTRFLNGKMLMLSITSIQSFVYNLSYVFMFPYDIVKEIYKKMKFKNIFLFQNLTHKDITSLFFIFLCKLSCSINEKTIEQKRIEKKKKVEQKRFQIINDSMQMKFVKKTQFAGLND